MPSKLFRLIAGVVLALLVAGGVTYYLTRPVRIGDILSHPDRYQGRTVSVRGVVTGSYAMMGVAVYRLRDESGEILVVSDQGAPRDGTQKTVRGEVVQVFKGMGMEVIALFEGTTPRSVSFSLSPAL